MCSRKNRQLSTTSASNGKTNGDDLRRALNWILNDTMFTNLRVHGNASWTAVGLIRLAVFWVWSPESSLVAAADDAIGCVTRIFGSADLHSYQAITKALKRYSDQLLAIMWDRLHVLMKRCDDANFRVGLWLALAVDGSRVGVPRTFSNEQRFCKPPSKRKKGKKSKKRGRHAKRSKAPTHQKSHYDPQSVGPQMWLTMIWHMGQQLPWCWRTGPSYSSERQHVMDMLEEHVFPENTLFCADAGFVGYDFWRAIHDRGHHFLIRVGGNVRLLRNLGYFRERDGIVYSWPDAAMKKKQAPLILRLLHFKDLRGGDIYLVTNVLDAKRLPARQASTIFRQRWGIEVQFRSLKQTFGRTKLRSRSPDCATIELHWSLIGLTIVQLLARKEQAKAREPAEQTSIATVLRIVRWMMQRSHEVPSQSDRLTKQLAQAVTDNYKRKSKKKSRNFPRRKEEPATGKPMIKTATSEHKQRLKHLLNLAAAG
jgi:hypothetical protein